IGSVASLASVSIDAATDVTMNGTVNVGSFSATNGTSSIAINSGITTSDSGGITLAAPAINLAGAINAGGGGDVSLDHSGALTIATGSSFDVGGSFSQTGGGTV